MAEREGPGEAGCPDCGSEIRPGDAFCASCGKPLGTADSDPAPHEPALREPDADRTKPVGDAQDEAVSRSNGQPVQTGPGGRRSWSEVLRGCARWFEELPIVSKVLLVGLAILVTLPLLALLIPLALVVSPLLLVVGLIGLIVRLGQRRSAKGWGVVAAASLVLAFALAGVSSAYYGGQLLDATGEGKATNTGDTKGEGSSKNKGTVPSYRVIDSQQLLLSKTYRHVVVHVFSDSVSEEDLSWIAKDIRPELRGNDSAVVMVWDEDRVTSYERGQPFPVRVRSAGGGQLLPEANITFALSPLGASGQGIPEGEYEIGRDRGD